MRLLAALLAVALFGCSEIRPAPTATEPARRAIFHRIAYSERARTLGDEQPLLQDAMTGEPDIRIRAYLALARIQIERSANAIVLGLDAEEAPVRAAAAFAAGELGLSWQPIRPVTRSTLVEATISALSGETDPAARQSEIEALGKLGSPRALYRLYSQLPDEPAAATAIGVAAKREKLPDEVFKALLKIPPNAHGPYVYALAASKDPRAREALLGRVDDKDPDVRATAIKGLGDVGQPADAEQVAKLDDPEPRVAAESVRTLVRLAAKCTADQGCPPLDVLGKLAATAGALDTQPARAIQTVLAFAQAPLTEAARPLVTSVREAVAKKRDAAGAPELDCRLAAALDRLAARVDEVRKCGFDKVSEARRLGLGLDAVAQADELGKRADLAALEALVDSKDATVRVKAVQALGATGRAEAAEKVRPLIGNEDLVLASYAAAVAGQLHDEKAAALLPALIEKVGAKLPEEAGNLSQAAIDLKARGAVPALQAWLHSKHANLRIEAARALTVLTGDETRADLDINAPIPERTPPPDGTTLEVTTEAGKIRILLDPAHAPQTAANFAELAKKGFFNGLTFHRIVPNFVVQGGDPRGDGEGGPGYTIPCEVNPLHYRRGTVGVALSGKDTGGSQFFIALSPQPHLDGRYTAFGQVIAGMDVAEKLVEGAKIIGVTVQHPK